MANADFSFQPHPPLSLLFVVCHTSATSPVVVLICRHTSPYPELRWAAGGGEFAPLLSQIGRTAAVPRRRRRRRRRRLGARQLYAGRRAERAGAPLASVSGVECVDCQCCVDCGRTPWTRLRRRVEQW